MPMYSARANIIQEHVLLMNLLLYFKARLCVYGLLH